MNSLKLARAPRASPQPNDRSCSRERRMRSTVVGRSTVAVGVGEAPSGEEEGEAAAVVVIVVSVAVQCC
jgi:hypothetical protein